MDCKAYTTERLQQSLAYCQRFLSRRDISPRSETFMILFKDELKIAIEAESDDDKLAAAASTRVFELLIQRNAFLSAAASIRTQEMQQNLLELRELQYYSRYGDYVRIIPTRLRPHASEHKTTDWQLLCGRFRWSEIATRLSWEQQTMHERLRTEGSAAMNTLALETHVAVYTACRELGISDDVAIWSIIQYGEHLEDIDCVFSDLRSDTDKTLLKAIIRDEINRCFDCSADPNDVNIWIAKQELIQQYKAAQGKGDINTKAQKKA
ncbi:hypothetical protein MMC22_001554 [Lobaria immixta]|nr:hypothetical protein [Lobaria immixta]